MAENRRQKEQTSKLLNVHFAYLNTKRDQYDSSKSSANLVKDSLNQIDMSTYRNKKKNFEIRYFSDPKQHIKTDRGSENDKTKDQEKNAKKNTKHLTYEQEIKLFKQQCQKMDPKGTMGMASKVGKLMKNLNIIKNKQEYLKTNASNQPNYNEDQGLNMFLKSANVVKQDTLVSPDSKYPTFDINMLDSNLRKKIFFPQSKVKDHKSNNERKFWKLQTKMVYDENLRRYHAVTKQLAFEDHFCDVLENNHMEEYEYLKHKNMHNALKFNKLNTDMIQLISQDKTDGTFTKDFNSFGQKTIGHHHGDGQFHDMGQEVIFLIFSLLKFRILILGMMLEKMTWQ